MREFWFMKASKYGKNPCLSFTNSHIKNVSFSIQSFNKSWKSIPIWIPNFSNTFIITKILGEVSIWKSSYRKVYFKKDKRLPWTATKSKFLKILIRFVRTKSSAIFASPKIWMLNAHILRFRLIFPSGLTILFDFVFTELHRPIFINVKNLIHLKFYSWSIMNSMIQRWIIYFMPEGMQSIDMRSMGRCWTDLHEVGFLVFVEFDSWFFLAWRIHLVTMSENKTVSSENCRSSCNDNDGLVHWIIDSLYYGWRLLDKLYSDLPYFYLTRFSPAAFLFDRVSTILN